MRTNKVFCRILASVLGMALLLPTALTACGNDASETTTGGQADSTKDPSSTGAPESGMMEYTVKAKTEGGMMLSGVNIEMKDIQGNVVATAKTDANGSYTTWLYPAQYTVSLTDLKPGYSAESVKTTEDGGETLIVAKTSVVTSAYPNQPTSYAMGDLLYDFSFMKDGNEVKISDLLQTKKLIVLNFWATWCGPCVNEFPAIEEAYQAYSDDVEIVAMSISDNAAACTNFKTNNGYTFNMVPDNATMHGLFKSYHGGTIPITVFVDRYGMITEYVSGGNTDSGEWKKVFAHYISDDYIQSTTSDTDTSAPSTGATTEKPDVEMPASSEIEQAINGAGFNGSYTASSSDIVWPWVLTDDKTAIAPSNYGKHGTSAMIDTEVVFGENQVLAFDCKYAVEYDTYGTQIYDLFAVYVDGHIMQKMVGKQDEWTTCYVYTPVEPGQHTVTLVYVKDSSDGYMTEGKEYVNVRNMRLISIADMTAEGGSMNVYRPAASGVAPEGSSTSYLNYATVVLNKKDGYYHVGTADGPILLAKLCGATAWSGTSLDDMAYAGLLVIGGVDYSDSIDKDLTRSYCWLETNSDLGYSVVDEQLADLLDLFASSLGNGANHEYEWLEFCSYFDHYGTGKGITEVRDVRSGIDMESAFPATVGKNHAVINRLIVPRGHFFEFVPEKTGVYSFYSLSEGATTTAEGGVIDTIAWLYDKDGNVVDESLDDYNETHFNLFYRCEAGETYYVAVGFDPVDDMGEFDFMIEYVGEKLDILTECTEQFTTTEDGASIIIIRKYDFHAALGKDGYYHQILSYDDNNNPILDYSEHGYVYVNFLAPSVFTSYIPWVGSYCTLESYIKGYYNPETGTKLGGFDFTERTDDEGNSLAELGNHQAEMEAYLAQALAATGDDHGYAKADQKLVEILNDLVLLYGEAGVEDEWLMFASFYRHV